MSWIWWALSLSSATPTVEEPVEPEATSPAPAAEVSFVFEGQPDCVTIDYRDGATHLSNGCDGVLLVDQSVQPGFRPLAPGEHVVVKDLSAFTLGLDGELYAAVAHLRP